MKNWILLAVYSTTFFNAAIGDPVAIDLIDTPKTEELVAINATLSNPNPISFTPTDPILPTRKVNPTGAVLLSALFPGLGHVYLGDMQTAGALAGTTSLAYSATVLGATSDSEAFFSSGPIILQNTWSYGIYAAYRDARIQNGQSGYSYKMPTDSFSDLATAPFRFSILKKPEVWGGVLGALAIGFTVISFAYPREQVRIQPNGLSLSGSSIKPLMALPVGIGEEALFRGYLQSQLSESFHSPSAGIAVSSLAFGAAHIPNAQALPKQDRWRYYAFSLPLITSLGLYQGYLTHKNGSMQESVAVHTLYDFVLFSIGALAGEASTAEGTGFSMSIPF